MRIGADLVTTTASVDVRSPYDGRLVGRVPDGGKEHLDRAVSVASATRGRGPLPRHERAAVLDRAAALLDQRSERFATLICDESAKPISTARVEAERAVDTLRFSAAVARTAGGDLLPLDASVAGTGKTGFVRRVPIGVVAGITPFNFPLNLVCHKVAPAVAAGCPIVVKPAPATPLSALALADLLAEAGLPDGWLQVVTCEGPVAAHLVTHDDVAMVTFTGSAQVGWAIRAQAPRKKVALELGNNAPVIIEGDGDWEGAAGRIRGAGFSFSGQSCISTQRIYVHESVADPFVDALASQVASIRVGDPARPDTEMSSLIGPAETARVRAWIDEAVGRGARIVQGGSVTPDGILTPTLLDGAPQDAKVCTDEVFGPVVTVARYRALDEAFALANDTRFGLQASVFTSSLATALRAGDVLRFGGVLVNEVPTWRADNMPYGGIRDSGNTREGPASAVREMTEERLIVLQP